MGMAALVALSIIDYVRGLPRGDAGASEQWTSRANEYIAYLVESRDDEGLWFGRYRYDGGAAFGSHSPYSDGEALLALVKAMKYLGRDDLAPIVEEGGRRRPPRQRRGGAGRRSRLRDDEGLLSVVLDGLLRARDVEVER